MRKPIAVSLLIQDFVSLQRCCAMPLRNEYEGGKLDVIRSSCVVVAQRLLVTRNREVLMSCRCDREDDVIATVINESLLRK